MPYYKALVPTGDWKQTRRHIGCFYVQAKNMIEAIDNIKKNPSVLHNQMLPVNR